jgi:hypothetical protein
LFNNIPSNSQLSYRKRVGLIVNIEVVEVWNKLVMEFFNNNIWHLVGRTEENHRNQSRLLVSGLRFKPWNS